MATFPGGIPSFAGFTASHTLAADSHAAQHNLEQAEIVQIATKIGTGASTPVANRVLRGTGAGTSAWAQTDLTSDVTGTLPVANGGTGITSLGSNVANFLGTPSSANLLAALTNETGTGAAVFANTPTLVTPNIADFTNAQHDHGDTDDAGPLASESVNFAMLLSTIFSGQVSTFTNTGTAGGTSTFFYVNLGGIKLFWGVTNSVTANANNSANYTIILPTSFFSTVQFVSYDIYVATGSATGNAVVGIGTGVTTLTFSIANGTGSNGVGGQVSSLVIGT